MNDLVEFRLVLAHFSLYVILGARIKFGRILSLILVLIFLGVFAVHLVKSQEIYLFILNKF